jgi:GNAT superfamily N-acetyltransferase
MEEPAHFKLVVNLAEELREAVGTLLRNYNYASNRDFFTSRDLPENAPMPLNIVVYDAAGTVIGGLLAETQFAWLKISIVAVAEHARRHGIGRRLLEIAEQEAKSRGCKHVFLDTMEYQAPDFYRLLGYQLAGKLDNWDSHGHAQYFFTKQLA